MTQSAIPYAISYENEFGCKDITSTYMRDAIKKWYELYRYKPHDPAAPHTSDPSLKSA